MSDIYEGMRSKEHSERVKKALKVLSNQGVKLGAPTKLDDYTIAMILDLRRNKHTYKQIAYITGVSVGTAHKIVKRFKIYVINRVDLASIQFDYP